MLICPSCLLLEHRDIFLKALVDFALSLNLSLDSAQVLKLNKVRLEPSSLVLLGDLAAGATGTALLSGG